MNLILLETVEGLGRPGDQVRVKDGFARNFLLPGRKAVRNTPDALRMLGRLHRKAEEEERELIASMEDLAAKVKGVELEVRARATEERHLFGSVTEKDIHTSLVEAGWDAVPLRAVRLTQHIKEAGEFELELHLHGDILAPYKLTVVPVDLDGEVIEEFVDEEHDDAEGDEGDEGGDSDDTSAEGDAPAASEAAAVAPESASG
ncbi:MAG: hypothetical protein DHS20C15_25260 [Planctomycetota bacterium]|nr:MAG: hypothetical protein DHS20C15_25260 [Planctomycetota bacterium]